MLWRWFKRNSKPASPRLELGARGEDHAARHLRRQGYKILVRRFRSRSGEIDIVARHGEFLVFVEVKTRVGDEFGAPSEAVDKTKQRHITRVALDYLRMLEYPDVKFRFDIVEVIMQHGARKPDRINLVQDAFEMSEPYMY
jgi:putative endonuclease